MLDLRNYIINEAQEDPAVSAITSVLKPKLDRNWFCFIDNTMFQNIQDTFEQVHPEEKKGTQWKLVIDGSFLDKMMMVSVKKGIWRYAMDKEIYGKTVKNFEKDFVKKLTEYDNLKFADDFGVTLWGGHKFFLINEYVKVNSPDPSWRLAFTDIDGECLPIRVDINGQQWGFDKNKKDAEIRQRTASALASNANLAGHKTRYHVADEVMKYIYNNFKEVGDDYDDTLTWSRMGWGAESNNDIMVCGATKQWRHISWKDTSNSSEMDKALKDIVKRSKYGAYCLSEELYKYIKSTFDQDLTGTVMGKWYTVYYNDSKYGRFMINIDKKLWRKPSFDEFYGGGVVD